MRINPNQSLPIAQSPIRKSINDEGFKIQSTLTKGDKAIIEEITPTIANQNGVQQINPLATLIALERSSGNLKGEIDQNYAAELKKRISDGKSDVVSTDLLDKLLNAVSKNR